MTTISDIDDTIIGRGTYGTVCTTSNGDVEKIMIYKGGSRWSTAMMWEVIFSTTLNHRNIAKAIDILDRGDSIHIVMERYYPIKIVDTSIMFKLIHALHYMHSLDILHRDLKPSNIMMDGDEPIIIDFSISRMGILPSMYPGMYSSGYRHKNVSSGMYGFEADVYALGMTFLSILLGEIFIDEVPDLTYLGDEGKIIQMMLNGASTSTLLSLPLFKYMEEPSSGPPNYKKKKSLNDETIDMVRSLLSSLEDVTEIHEKLCLYLLSQMEDLVESDIVHVILVTIALLEDHKTLMVEKKSSIFRLLQNLDTSIV